MAKLAYESKGSSQHSHAHSWGTHKQGPGTLYVAYGLAATRNATPARDHIKHARTLYDHINDAVMSERQERILENTCAHDIMQMMNMRSDATVAISLSEAWACVEECLQRKHASHSFRSDPMDLGFCPLRIWALSLPCIATRRRQVTESGGRLC